MKMKFNLFALTAVSTLAAAAPTRRGNKLASSCTTVPIQCCNSVDTAGSSSVAALLGLLDIVVQDVNVLVGPTCVPITIIDTGGTTCISISEV
ncbi:hypothetical protein Moror_3704 [Moniliophthora roreri MCA 2997]|uniref:Hydrophobin n=1 Tax=Moniliophthora roreri (strain MCA 2997) TaxID=1381753 RepID=V2WLS6_MONRO|nr:hypothetical protein Moror_3704 [Moniliophthora roreri MCA 2997]KAI3608227.1 hypothetical protein WG66_006618 [Moniliophthora roreri]